MKSFPQQRDGERGALLAQDQEKEASQKAAEELQAQVAADDKGLFYVSSLSPRCEELEVQLLDMTDENTGWLKKILASVGRCAGQKRFKLKTLT